MNSSFYTAATGAYAHQQKLNVLSNNFANINTTAYKAATPVFADLMYTNRPEAQAGGHLQEGNGLKLDKTDINLRRGSSLEPTGGKMDFAIVGDGFFAVKEMDGEDIFYTRDGRFMMTPIDDNFYLTNAMGQVVLDEEEEPIEITEEMQAQLDAGNAVDFGIGVFTFPIMNGMDQTGFNNFRPVEKSGEVELVESPDIRSGHLESSGVDMSDQMTWVIEAQRAYSYSLKMVQTSEEVEQEINSLRR